MTLGADYYEDLQGQLRGLLIALEGRLTRDQAALLNELVDANESGVALEMMIDILSQQGEPIARQLLEQMVRLAERMGLSTTITTVNGLSAEDD